MYAAEGFFNAFDPDEFELITSASDPEFGGGLHVKQPGFTVRQRASMEVVGSLTTAEALLAEPYHNVVA